MNETQMIEEIKMAISELWRADKISSAMFMKAIANTEELYKEAA